MIKFKKQKVVNILGNYPCDRRELDSSRLSDYFKANSCRISDRQEDSDYIVLVTCAWHSRKEDECFKLIDKLSRYNGELIVVGCLPSISPDKLKDIFKGKFVSSKDLDRIDDIFSDFKVKFRDIPDSNTVSRVPNEMIKKHCVAQHRNPPENKRKPPYLTELSRLRKKFFCQFEISKRFFLTCYKAIRYRLEARRKQLLRKFVKKRKRAYLRVTRGCFNRCTYCSIRKAVGPLKSKPIDECLKEYKKLIKRGCKKVTLVGEDIGSYGIDNGSSFPELLQALYSVDKGCNVKWFFSEMSPKWLIRYKSELIRYAELGKIEKFACFIQSGSDRILQLMNRQYKINEAVEAFNAVKKADDKIEFINHFIIGFPSETEDDFFASMDILKKIKFCEVHMFSYSDRRGTMASQMKEKIDPSTIQKRIEIADGIARKEGVRCFRVDHLLLEHVDSH